MLKEEKGKRAGLFQFDSLDNNNVILWLAHYYTCAGYKAEREVGFKLARQIAYCIVINTILNINIKF